jgi:radical SAM superfamily enzyme YgiQ (UPF0313 family)
MKNILLIKPNAGSKNVSIAPPMGLLYLASYIRKHSTEYNFNVVDLRIDSRSPKQLEKLIKFYAPDLVGISACSEDDKQLHRISRIVKMIDNNIKVVCGGPHATMYYEDILKDKNIDFAVIGEGEITFHELLESLKNGRDCSGISGLAINKDGKACMPSSREFITDLDVIPFPAWDLIKIEKYSSLLVPNMNDLLSGHKYMGIVTSRGCPYKCIYCHKIMGKKFRHRSAENVFNEIKLLVAKYDIDEFHIFDDIFNFDIERAHAICDMIIEAGLKIKIAFPNGIRGDLLDEKLLLKMKRAGVYMVTFAVEAASKRQQKLIRKNINIDKLLENIKFADKLGMITRCFFMIGFPDEKIEEINKTIQFALKSPLCFASFFIVVPHKGTEIFKIVKKYVPEYEVQLDGCNYFTKNKSYEDFIGIPLKKLQRAALLKFYFNPQRIFKIYVRIPRKIFFYCNLLRIRGYLY